MQATNGFCPYVGLRPFRTEEKDYFFGREREQRTIFSNLSASPLTVLYGPTATGKSSVLRAGLIPLVQRQSPGTGIVYFSAWQQDGFLDELKRECVAEAARATKSTIEADVSKPLDALLEDLLGVMRQPLLVILDQFEEYLLYHPETEQARPFEAELARAITLEEGGLGFLISLREDSLSKLDRFRLRIPNLLANTLRLQPLQAPGAEDAIRKPLGVFKNRFPGTEAPVGIEDGLLEEVLKDPRSWKGAQLGDNAGLGQVAAEKRGDEFEPSVLQIVMTRVWDREKELHSPMLRRETLVKDLGGVGEILDNHLDRIIESLTSEERDLCADLLRFLVTPSGGKIAYSPYDLARSAERSQPEVENVLQKLVAAGVLRRIPAPIKYELLHDILAPALLSWRTRHVEARRLEKQAAEARAAADNEAKEREARLKSRGRWIVTLITSAAAVIAGFLGMHGYQKAQEAQRYAEESRRYAEESKRNWVELVADRFLDAAKTEEDPELRLLYALYATSLSEKNGLPLDRANRTLQELLSTRTIATRSETVAFTGIGKESPKFATANADGKITLWDLESSKAARILSADAVGFESITHVGPFSTGAERLAVSSKKGAAVWNLVENKKDELAGKSERRILALSPGDRRLIIADGEKRLLREPQDEAGTPLPKDFSDVKEYFFRPGSEEVAAIDSDRLVRTWETKAKESKVLFPKIMCDRLAIRSDGRYLAATSGHDVLLYDLGERKRHTTLRAPPPAKSSELYEANLGTPKRAAQTRKWLALGFGPLDGNRLAACDEKGNVYIWDFSHETPLSTRKVSSPKSFALFSPDLRWIVWNEFSGCGASDLLEVTDPVGIAKSKVHRALTFREFRFVVEDLSHQTFVQGEEAATRGETVEAATQFENGLKTFRTIDPELPFDARLESREVVAEGFVDAARELAAQGDLDGVLEKVRSALTLDGLSEERQARLRDDLAPALRRAILSKARALDLEAATNALGKARKLLPDAGENLPTEADLRERAAEFLFDEAERAAETDFAEAAPFFEQARKLIPDLAAGIEEKVKKAAVESLLARWESLFVNGDLESAHAEFEKAKRLAPAILEEDEMRKVETRKLVREGVRLIGDKQILEAVKVFKDVRQRDPKAVSTFYWNLLCWKGLLAGHAADVLFAGDLAVEGSPGDSRYLDSRGVARALTGNLKGALADFEAAQKIENPNSTDGKNHSKWVPVLREGKNPITAEVLNELR